MKILAELDPVPLARPRVNTKTRRAFYPERSKNFNQALALIAKAQMKDKSPLTGNLSVTVSLYRKVKADSKNFGDVDNHLKAIFDALNGICWQDDAQIVKTACTKHKDNLPRLEIFIEEIEQ